MKSKLRRTWTYVREHLFRAFIAFAGIFLLAAVLILAFVPQARVEQLEKRGSLSAKERVELENAIRNSLKDSLLALSQMIGGLVVIVGAYSAWRTARFAEAEKTEQRYAKAIEYLHSADSDTFTRSQAIENLTLTAREFPRVEPEIMKHLMRYVQDNAQRDRSTDHGRDAIQKCMSAIGLRSRAFERRGSVNLDFSSTDLRNIVLRCTHFEGANFSEANLAGADLTEAELDRANLRGCCLSGANLRETDMDDADMEGVILHGVDCTKTEMKRANLANANLQNACLRKADLRGAVLMGADVKGVDFEFTHLEGANLEGAINLTREQLRDAITSAETRLPEGRAS